MLVLGIILLSMVALCWLVSVGVCLRHCLCRHLLPDICGYSEDFAAEEIKLRDMMVQELENDPHFGMDQYDDIDG